MEAAFFCPHLFATFSVESACLSSVALIEDVAGVVSAI